MATVELSSVAEVPLNPQLVVSLASQSDEFISMSKSAEAQESLPTEKATETETPVAVEPFELTQEIPDKKDEDTMDESVEQAEETVEVIDAVDENPAELATAEKTDDKKTEVVEEKMENEIAKKLSPFPFVPSRSFQIKSQQKPFAFNRALSFDGKRAKRDAGVQEGAAPKPGIPLLRRLSFRGKKEMKAQLERNHDSVSGQTGIEAPAPKPPLPKTSTPGKPPLAASPVPPKAHSIEVNVPKDNSEARYAEEKKEDELDELKVDPSLISTRSEQSFAVFEGKPGLIAQTLLGSDSALKEMVVDVESSNGEASVVPALSKTNVPVTSSDRVPNATSSSSPDGTEEETSEPPLEEEHDHNSKTEEDVPLVESAKSNSTKEEMLTVPLIESSKSNSAKEETAKDEDDGNATETTDVEGDMIVTEEKAGGLFVTSSASEVEVTAGKNFFCDKFCCGLGLTTAGST